MRYELPGVNLAETRDSKQRLNRSCQQGVAVPSEPYQQSIHSA